VLALILLAAGGTGHAQAPAPPSAPTARINITLEQQHVIKEVIKDLNVAPAEAAKVAVGDALPEGVALQPMPPEIARKVPQIKSHQFAVLPDKIAIVDPKDRKVVELIDRHG
jgi:hypothetical protein